MERPIRTYAYRGSVWLQVLADALAAVLTALCIQSFQGTDPFWIMPTFVLSSLAALVSFQVRRRRRALISLYADRIAWIGPFGRRREAALTELRPPTPTPSFLSDAPGLRIRTPAGTLRFTQQLSDFGDLARRLEGARYGWAHRNLPPSRLPWTGPTAYLAPSGLRRNAIFKGMAALTTILAGFVLVGSFDAWIVVLALLFGLLFSALMDFSKYRHARIELIGDELVQFDRWDRRRGSVRVDTIHYAGFQDRWLQKGVVIEGEEGAITIDRQLDGSVELVEHIYRIIADRHSSALPQTSTPVAPAPSVTVRS
ncbi:MAG: hypothetical protein ACO1SV_13795 [Fimbriimonas sp.]